jgi:hypothetical protein
VSCRRPWLAPLPIAVRQALAPAFARLHEPHLQRCMGADKMGVGSPPLQMGQQLWSLLGSGPSTSCKRCHPITDSQIHPLDESGVHPSGETEPEASCL